MNTNRKNDFEKVCAAFFNALTPQETLSLELRGEQSLFVRYNASKIRQIGEVEDFVLTLSYFANGCFLQRLQTLPRPEDVQTILKELRSEVTTLPKDPYAVPPTATAQSEYCLPEQASPFPANLDEISECLGQVHLTGILAGGPLVRASANSCGAKHWFETQRVNFDYSLSTKDNRMVTACYSDTTWSTAKFKAHVAESFAKQQILQKPALPIKPGKYRVYLAPAAMETIFSMMNYGSFSAAKAKQGQSALDKLIKGEKQFAAGFTITEDFSTGTVPRFNAEGDVAPEQIPLVRAGKHANTLVNSRSAKEYGFIANGANSEEFPRAMHVAGGQLAQKSILKELHTGLYLSNLHYLNWSDRMEARITGMTRFACVWVENGEPQGPLQKDLRFDVSLYDIFNTNLLGLTQEVEFIPDILTYNGRECGGISTPGALIEDFVFTL